MRTCRHESGGMCGALLDPLCISMAVSSRIHCTRWNHPRLVCSTLWCVSSDSGRLAYILASGPMLHMNVSALIRVCEYATIYIKPQQTSPPIIPPIVIISQEWPAPLELPLSGSSALSCERMRRARCLHRRAAPHTAAIGTAAMQVRFIGGAPVTSP
jgi:hypothetical protein